MGALGLGGERIVLAAWADPSGGTRRGAYEYGTREPMPGITPRPLPEG
jgi:hypothetical protein